MKGWIVVSLLMHAAFLAFLYINIERPSKIPHDAVVTLNLVALAAPAPEPKQEAAPVPPAPVEQPKPPESRQPEPQVEPPPPEPPKPVVPAPKEPEPVVVKNTASDIRERLAKRIEEQRRKREQQLAQTRPTPTPIRLAGAVPTVALERVPEVRPEPRPTLPPSAPGGTGLPVKGPVTIQLQGQQGRYDYYLSAIQNALRENWTVPQIPNVQQYITEVELVIQRDGRLVSHRILSSSRDAFFDRSVQDAVLAARFPPFPEQYPDPQMTVIARFRPIEGM